MSGNTVLWTVALMVLSVVGSIALDRLRRPRERTKRLVMAVWAAFGPYENSEVAAFGLRRAYGAVFGHPPAGAHQEWLNGHIRNLSEAESEGRFEVEQNFMRGGQLLNAHGEAFSAACNKIRTQLQDEVQGFENELYRIYPPLRGMLRPNVDPDGRRGGIEKP